MGYLKEGARHFLGILPGKQGIDESGKQATEIPTDPL